MYKLPKKERKTNRDQLGAQAQTITVFTERHTAPPTATGND